MTYLFLTWIGRLKVLSTCLARLWAGRGLVICAAFCVCRFVSRTDDPIRVSVIG